MITPHALEILAGVYPDRSFAAPGLLPAVKREVHPLADSHFEWPDFVRVRFPGEDASRCIAAIGPYLGTGVPETARFLAGANRRGETALGIWEAGPGSRVGFPPYEGAYLVADELPRGPELDLVGALPDLDRDFALRVRNGLSADATLYALSVEAGPPLQPLLVDGIGHPVVAAWAHEDRAQCWYVVPVGTKWESIVGWLFDRAIKAYVPTAARRIPALTELEHALLTAPERIAMEELKRFESEIERAERASDRRSYGRGIRLTS